MYIYRNWDDFARYLLWYQTIENHNAREKSSMCGQIRVWWHILTCSVTEPSCSHPTWWRHQMETFPCYWPFVWGIHRSSVNSPHKGQWRGALVFSLICVRLKGWINNREAGDLRRYHVHYDVTVMIVDIRLLCIMKGETDPSHFYIISIQISISVD